MLKLTKIFHFEMAHAIHGHTGNCKNIHGHSYELHVTVSAGLYEHGFIPAPGFIMDFKEIKKMVTESVIEKFDHSLLLSRSFMVANPSLSSLQNLVIFEEEPTAENLLLHIKQELQQTLNDNIKLVRLLLFETKDSYAEWTTGQFCESWNKPIL